MVAVPFHDLKGAPGQRAERGVGAAQYAAQALQFVAGRRRFRMRQFCDIAMAPAIGAQINAAHAAQPEFCQVVTMRQVNAFVRTHQQQFRFLKGEPEDGFARSRGRCDARFISIFHGDDFSIRYRRGFCDRYPRMAQP